MSEYVFNAISNAPDQTTATEGRALTVTLLQTLAALDAFPGRANRPLKLPANPWVLPFCQDEHGVATSFGDLAHSLYEASETYPLAVYFDALNSQAPAIAALDDTVIDAILRVQPTAASPGQEAIYEAVCAAGFDAMQCFVTGGTLVSLDRDPWRFALARFECDGAPASLEHASRPDHVDELIQEDRLEARRLVTRRNFVAFRERAFPCLTWGADVDDQIERFPAEYLSLAFSRLASLDDIVRQWRASGAAAPDPGNLIFRGESELTMQNYGDLRRFRSASGQMATYETHLWIDTGNRLHFIIDTGQRGIEVGYIGTHLKTWKF
ncbi:hypothetical protein [Caulobacter sp. 3R27C2-B]|uniref:hypothetical protein n=1 Tax=Caulobacter sp. 3R27C2-B TaxID=2502219 RepID=UPI0010F7690C|nr:hypothetical protein [Caulobacter sp. 3R27C2-B]